jgi:hypothetical protein
LRSGFCRRERGERERGEGEVSEEALHFRESNGCSAPFQLLPEHIEKRDPG